MLQYELDQIKIKCFSQMTTFSSVANPVVQSLELWINPLRNHKLFSPFQSKMEEILLRFPYIREQTFKWLSSQSLAKSKTVSRVWYNFITNEKFYKLRVHYENIQKVVDEDVQTKLHKAAKMVNHQNVNWS